MIEFNFISYLEVYVIRRSYIRQRSFTNTRFLCRREL